MQGEAVVALVHILLPVPLIEVHRQRLGRLQSGHLVVGQLAFQALKTGGQWSDAVVESNEQEAFPDIQVDRRQAVLVFREAVVEALLAWDLLQIAFGIIHPSVESAGDNGGLAAAESLFPGLVDTVLPRCAQAL